MATDIIPTRPQNCDDDPNVGIVHPVVEGDEEHHEKKSVLKKMKDKARRIKHTLAKKAHGNGHEYDAPGPEVGEGYKEDDDEEEFDEEEPEIHGAPSEEQIGDQSRANLVKEEEHAPKDLQTQSFQQILEEQPRFEEDPQAPKDQPASPPNYQAKVADPTASGGSEAGDPLPALDRSLQDMKILDESSALSGSHDQFNPDPPFSQNTPANSRNPDPPTPPATQSQPATYAEKIAAATSAFAQKAAAAKDAIASKLRYNQPGSDDTGAPARPAEYGWELSPLDGQVAEAGSAVVAKISQGGGKKASASESPELRVKMEETEGGVKRSAAGVSVKEYIAEKLQPGDEHKALSEVICDAIMRRREEPEAEGMSDSGGSGGGKGLVETVRGTVASALGLGGESRESSEQNRQARGEEPELQASMT